MKKTKHKFVLETTFTPTGDQPTAIKELVAGLERAGVPSQKVLDEEHDADGVLDVMEEIEHLQW